MSIIRDNGNSFRANANNSIYLSGKSRYGEGSFLFFDAQSVADPLAGSSTLGLFVDSSNRLSFWNGTSTVRLTGSGAGTPTWEDIYLADATFALSSATWTITQSAAADLLTLTKTNVGAGAVLAINNSGSGNDVTGTSGLWSVSAAGLATFATGSIVGGTLNVGSGAADGTVSSNGNFNLVLQTGNATTNSITIVDGNNVDIDVAMQGAGKFEISGTTEGSVGFQLTNGDSVISDGSLTITDDDNAASVSVTNNTATTIGAAASSGVVTLVSTSLTTGALLNLQLTEGTLNGGWYLRAWDATGGGAVFSVGEDGLTTIAGVGGSNALVVTAGDVVLSDASVAITDADNAASFSLTNNTATTASVVVIAGSGAFTGSTTTSFATLTASGLTSGTVLYMPAAALTTGKIIDIVSASATDASFITLTGNTANQTTTGKMINIDLVANVAAQGLKIATTGAYSGTAGLVDLDAGAMATGVMLALTSTTGLTTGSLIRATTATAGAVATNGVVAITATGAYTSTANAGLLDVQASALVGTGTIVNIKATNGSQISNTALNIEQTTTTTGYTGDFVRIVGTSTTGDSNLIAVTCACTSAGDALQITGNGLVAGTSTLVNLVHGTSVLGAGNSMLRITSTGVDTGTTTGTLLDLASTAATAATLVLLTSASLATGKAVLLNLNGLTTGAGVHVAHTTAVIANGGSLIRASSTSVDTSTTTGTLLDLSSTSCAVGTLVQLLDTGLTTGAGVFVSHTTGVIASGGSLVRIKSTSIDTGTTTGALLDLAATAATTANLSVITSATLTTGTGMTMTLNGLTTGSGLVVSSSSTDTGARGLILLNQTGAGATGTSMIRMNQVVTSTNFRKIFTETNTGITLWWGNGTTANAALAATTGDVLLNGGSNKPEYCTNGAGSLWTALV